MQDMKATSEIVLMTGGKSEYFAAWRHLGDIWKTSGDFSILPPILRNTGP